MVQLTRFFVVILLGLTSVLAHAEHGAHWSATWAVANKTYFPGFDDARPVPVINNTTLRQIVRISRGGNLLRVWLTNELGTETLTIDAANIGIRKDGSTIKGHGKALTFNGEQSVEIPAGERIASDPVRMHASDQADLAISLFIADNVSATESAATYHPRALQTNYVASGNQASEKRLSDEATNFVYTYLAAVDVATHAPVNVIATFGDSLTDGDQVASNEPIDSNDRYPNFLATALLTFEGRNNAARLARPGVVNLGISGNQVLSPLLGDSAVNRFAADVTHLSGVTHVVIWEGINDIGLPPLFGAPYVDSQTLIAGLQSLADQAHEAGLQAIGCTLTPSGAFYLPSYTTPEADDIRQDVNDWIRTSGTFDAVVDLDYLLRDTITPNLLRADITVDGLHLNAAGYEIVGNAVAAAVANSD